MKRYTLQSELTFGKYSGMTIDAVTAINPGYIIWCLLNLNHFFISETELKILENKYPSLHISKETWKAVANKMKEDTIKEKNSFDYPLRKRYYSQDEMEMGDWDYNPLNEAHVQDNNPWIEVFGPGEEAETAYWNCD